MKNLLAILLLVPALAFGQKVLIVPAGTTNVVLGPGALDDLTDVGVAPSPNDYLYYDGASWTNTSVIVGAVTNETDPIAALRIVDNNWAITGGLASAGTAYTNVVQGTNNLVIGLNSSIYGDNNEASSIVGGIQNIITNAAGLDSGGHFIGAGLQNKITAQFNGAVVGGQVNTMAGSRGFIGAGLNNDITTGNENVVVGGDNNNITSGDEHFIGGGAANDISAGFKNVVAGGWDNDIAGGQVGFIGGGYLNEIGSSASDYNVIPGGLNNRIERGNYNTIGGGTGNKVTASLGGILQGNLNEIISVAPYTDTGYGFVGNGYSNRVTYGSAHGAILNGRLNYLTNSPYSTILNGVGNSIDTATNSIILQGSSQTLSTDNRALIGNDLEVGGIAQFHWDVDTVAGATVGSTTNMQVILASGTSTVTLHSAATSGDRVKVKNIGAGITYVVPQAGDQVDNFTVHTNDTQYNSYEYVSDGGTNWFIW